MSEFPFDGVTCHACRRGLSGPPFMVKAFAEQGYEFLLCERCAHIFGRGELALLVVKLIEVFHFEGKAVEGDKLPIGDPVPLPQDVVDSWWKRGWKA
jgi:hypothetical protein